VDVRCTTRSARASTRLDFETLREHAAEVETVFRDHRIILLRPALARGRGITRQLSRFTNTFRVGWHARDARVPRYTRIMAARRNTHRRHARTPQSLLPASSHDRRLDNDRLVGRLSHRAGEARSGFPGQRDLPDHAIRTGPGWDVKAFSWPGVGRPSHRAGRRPCLPLAPADSWSGDGIRAWADYTDDEQNGHRALAQTLGNLALLESSSAERARRLPSQSTPVREESDGATPHARRGSGLGNRRDQQANRAAHCRLPGHRARPPTVGIDDLTPITRARCGG
jgi:hypothetical protein